jgi:glutamine synthetase
MLGRGLAGIERSYELPRRRRTNIYEMSEDERARRGHPLAAEDCYEGIAARDHSRSSARRSADHVVEFLIRNKRRGSGIAYKVLRHAVRDRALLPIL